MATLYGRGRGKAGSHKPAVTEKSNFGSLSNKEIEDIIVKLGKQGIPSAKIGLTLRDNYGVGNVRAVLGKKIEKVLDENKIEHEPQEIVSLSKKIKKLKKHAENNKQDRVGKRGLQMNEAKLRRVQKYHS